MADEGAPDFGQARFLTTHWSLVLAAGDSATTERSRALENLCRIYWYPLYAYVRRTGHEPEDAKDLTQAFFNYFLQKGAFALADPQRGRFRTFLLSALKHFLINEYHRNITARRGGGRELISLDDIQGEERYALEPSDSSTPDVLFEQRWALTQLERALTRLREEYHAQGQGPLFEALKAYAWGEKNSGTLADLAAELGMSEEAVKKAVQRLRQRYAGAVRQQIAETVTTPAELEDELRHLAAVLGR
jgi:RNA polymerase sigma-70 factor (ECF subfamily)